MIKFITGCTSAVTVDQANGHGRGWKDGGSELKGNFLRKILVNSGGKILLTMEGWWLGLMVENGCLNRRIFQLSRRWKEN